MTLRNRLTLWYSIVLFAVLCGFAAAIVWMEGQLGVRRIDRELGDVEATVVKIIGNELEEHETLAAAATEASETVADEHIAVAILDGSGAPLTSPLRDFDPGQFRTSNGQETVASTRGGSDGWRVRSRTVQIGGSPMTIVLAMPLADTIREQRRIREAMIIGIPIALLLAGTGGWWLASIGLAPIAAMATRAVALSSSGSDDLGPPARHDELGQLTLAFNGLVARLRARLETERQFMADASHELRTPVSIIRSAAEVALSRDRRDEQEYRDTLAITRDQARRLGRLVEDMLVLARAEAGGYPVRAVDLDLGEVVDTCRRAVNVLAHEQGVRLQSAAPELEYRGDEDLLRRLVLNLLQNAIQHTPEGGEVAVHLTRENGEVKIRVADGGAGIPESERARIFDRFVRLDEARTGNGTGLGLPIAKWIAEVHGGTLVVEASGPNGSTFCATLPTDSEI